MECTEASSMTCVTSDAKNQICILFADYRKGFFLLLPHLLFNCVSMFFFFKEVRYCPGGERWMSAVSSRNSSGDEHGLCCSQTD